jgi:hypothetical protein
MRRSVVKCPWCPPEAKEIALQGIDMHVKTHHPEHHADLRKMYSQLKKTAIKREIVQKAKGQKKTPVAAAPPRAVASTPPRSHHTSAPPRGPGPVPEHGRYPPAEGAPATPPVKKPATITTPPGGEGAGGESPAGRPGEEGDFLGDLFDGLFRWINTP